MTTIRKTILSALFFLLPQTLWAADVFVYPVEGGESGLRNSVQALINSAISEEGGYSVVEDVSQSKIQLRPKLLQLGTSYLVTIDRSEGGKILFSSKLKSKTAEDLDTVTGRAVRAVLRGVGTRESAQIDDVTEDEVKRGTNRFESVGNFKLGLGPAWADDMNVGGTGTHLMIGYGWSLDPQWDVNLAWRYTGFSKDGETGASFNDFQIGATYLFTLNRNSPYASLGFGRGTASVSSEDTGLFKFSGDRASGWSGHAAVGYRFFRTSSVSFAVEGNYSRIFSNSSDTGASPSVFDVALILLF